MNRQLASACSDWLTSALFDQLAFVWIDLLASACSDICFIWPTGLYMHRPAGLCLFLFCFILPVIPSALFWPGFPPVSEHERIRETEGLLPLLLPPLRLLAPGDEGAAPGSPFRDGPPTPPSSLLTRPTLEVRIHPWISSVTSDINCIQRWWFHYLRTPPLVAILRRIEFADFLRTDSSPELIHTTFAGFPPKMHTDLKRETVHIGSSNSNLNLQTSEFLQWCGSGIWYHPVRFDPNPGSGISSFRIPHISESLVTILNFWVKNYLNSLSVG